MHCKIESTASAGSKRGSNENDGDEMLILVGNKRNDRQPMPVLKRADVTTETVRVLSTVGTMYERCARNSTWQTPVAKARHAHRAEPQVCEGEGRDACTFLKDPPIDFQLVFSATTYSVSSKEYAQCVIYVANLWQQSIRLKKALQEQLYNTEMTLTEAEGCRII